jgi:antitoxin component HigA of HigAB toxin-antitoxin module
MQQINTPGEYSAAVAEIETYLSKGFDNLTLVEEEALETLSKKVNEYELVHFPMPVKG